MNRPMYILILIVLFGVVSTPTVFGATDVSVSTSTPVIKEVALTFDDGPYGTSTQEVLDILHKENVPATFFLIGQNVVEYPNLVKEIVANGDMIGNHTYDHPENLTTMPLIDQLMELSKTENAIASSAGVHATIFRPPYGNINQSLRNMLSDEGYKVVMWNVDPKDWNDASSTSQQIVSRILNHLKNHMTIVLHDGRDTEVGYSRENMIGALPNIIEDLKVRGYNFVTADKLNNSKFGHE